MLYLPWVEQIEFQIRYAQGITKLIIAVFSFDSISDVVNYWCWSSFFIFKFLNFSLNSHLLTLFELLAILDKLIELTAIVLIPILVVAVEGTRHHTSLLNLLHLLDEQLFLYVVSFFKCFGS